MYSETIGQEFGLPEDIARVFMEEAGVPTEQYGNFLNTCNSMREALGRIANQCRNCPNLGTRLIGGFNGEYPIDELERQALKEAQDCAGARLVVSQEGPGYLCQSGR